MACPYPTKVAAELEGDVAPALVRDMLKLIDVALALGLDEAAIDARLRRHAAETGMAGALPRRRPRRW
jgi:hypothetical protein